MEALLAQGVECARPILENDYLDRLIERGPCFAGIVDEGVAAACGLAEQNPGNYRCWMVSDPVLASYYFLPVNRAIRAFLAESHARRIETIVMAENAKGHRWVSGLLGFTNPHVMQGYGEDGDAVLYEWVRCG